MRSHRHTVWMILAALFTASACTAPLQEVGYNPLYPEFSSVRELWEAADLVLEGNVTSSTVQEFDATLTPSTDETPSPMVHTVHAVYVERVLKGTALPRTTVEVSELD